MSIVIINLLGLGIVIVASKYTLYFQKNQEMLLYANDLWIFYVNGFKPEVFQLAGDYLKGIF